MIDGTSATSNRETEHPATTLSVRQAGGAPGTVRLFVSGEIDMSTAAQFATQLAIAACADVVELDLNEIAFMDAQGLRVLIEAGETGSNVRIVAASRPVRRLVEITELAGAFGLPTKPRTTDNFDELAEDVVLKAVATISGCSSASITLIDRGTPATVAASDHRARTADEAQYHADSGPCLTAARLGSLVVVPRLVPGPGRYEEFRAAACSMGFASSMSVPVPTGASNPRRWSLNLYGESAEEFDSASTDAASALVDWLRKKLL